MIRFDLILPDLISCYQLLHGVVSLSKCCSGGYSLCTREVSSYNRPCPELLPSGDGVTMVTMPIHIWLPGAAWHHRHGQESDNERTWDRILGQATAATLVTYNLSSQGWRGERGHWDSCQISLPLTLSGPARAPPHYDTGCSLQHEFYAFEENLTERKSWLRKGFAKAARRRYLSYQFHCWRISCSKSNQI